jgi:hypothetical protein
VAEEVVEAQKLPLTKSQTAERRPMPVHWTFLQTGLKKV